MGFISWICPLMQSEIKEKYQYIYREENDITCMYFLIEGKAGFVLPEHNDLMYIKLNEGCHFGIIDIFSSLANDPKTHKELQVKKENIPWIQYQDALKRVFSIQCRTTTELLTLPLNHLYDIQLRFHDCYKQIFDNAISRLKKTLSVR